MLFQRARKPWRSRSRRCAISSSSDSLVAFRATDLVRFIALRRMAHLGRGNTRCRAVRNPINAPILAVCRDKREAELLAHDTGEEAADRMGLPLRCTCHRLDGRATWRSQHCNDASLFAFAAYSR